MSIRKNNQIIAGNYKTDIITEATQTESGKIRIATDDEVAQGLSKDTAITPYQLANASSKTQVDNETIIKDEEDIITTIGVKTKSNNILYDWVGTKAEYETGIEDGTISEDWFCWITDDNGQEIDKKRDLFDVVLKDHILSYEESFGYIQLGDYVYSTPVLGVRYGYPTFYNKCVTEKQNSSTSQITLGSNTITMYVNPNGHQYYDIADKDIVDTFYEATGIAWFYGVDIENERIFLPRNDYYFKNGSIDNVGVIVEAGLPNITGKIVANKLSDWLPDGAFSVYSEEASLNGGTNATRQKVNLDASLSNPIYGNSDTVQPPSVSVLAYMVVGNIKTNEGYSEVVSQGKEILEQVNEGLESRANLDLSNVEASQSFKEKAVSWNIPDYSKQIEITLTSNGTTTYTAPTNGFIYGKQISGTTDKTITINGYKVFSHKTSSGTLSNPFYYIVAKGDVVVVDCTTINVSANNYLIFAPMKGAN